MWKDYILQVLKEKLTQKKGEFLKTRFEIKLQSL